MEFGDPQDFLRRLIFHCQKKSLKSIGDKTETQTVLLSPPPLGNRNACGSEPLWRGPENMHDFVLDGKSY